MGAALPKPHPSLGLRTDPLAHLYAHSKSIAPRAEIDPAGMSTRHRRVVELAIKGLTVSQIIKAMAEEGMKPFSTIYTSNILRTPLIAARIENALNKTEAEAVEQRKALDQMLDDATDVLHQAARGMMLQPRVDEEGNIIEGAYDYVPVGARDRISAAKEILNRHPSTAPVTRNQTDVNHHGLLSPDAVLAARRDLDSMLAINAVSLAPQPPAPIPGLDDEDTFDTNPPWED